jgi:uncharacterized protein (DUF302 family)
LSSGASGTVADTVARLGNSVDGAGARVFHVVDFGGGARSVGTDIGDIQLVIFGAPRFGAAALSADPMSALDLPAKILVYERPDGTFMAYEPPAEMLADWNIPADSPLLGEMSSVLATVTDPAK